MGVIVIVNWQKYEPKYSVQQQCEKVPLRTTNATMSFSSLKNPWISIPFAVISAFVYPKYVKQHISLTNIINERIGCIAMIDGKSMQPTLNPNTDGKKKREWVLVNKLSVRNYKLNRGDVVMFK